MYIDSNRWLVRAVFLNGFPFHEPHVACVPLPFSPAGAAGAAGAAPAHYDLVCPDGFEATQRSLCAVLRFNETLDTQNEALAATDRIPQRLFRVKADPVASQPKSCH